MNWFDFFNHLLNLVMPALGVALVLGLLACATQKKMPFGLWFWRLVAIHSGVGVVVLVAGLLLADGDGRMATYGAMVLVMGAVHAWLTRS
ncbi:MAG: hypothetical protein GAK30_01215 [Paracidovorax wautersii]|uniref:Uncharacterized protein n=1 Tax=Paracidovorax wautersii TaxID=1177982 RepID=A0A7V8FQI6_9BURK|nr:MAG: hypothetical protein GAK30_01215 [Paracidovorax wautersii]